MPQTNSSDQLEYVKTFLEYGDVFSDIQPDISGFKVILAQLNTLDTIHLCATLLTELCNPNITNRAFQLKWGSLLFNQEEQGRMEQHIRQKNDTDFRTTYVFFRGQLLELIRWVSLCGQATSPDDGGCQFETIEGRTLFARAALISSKLWEQSIDRDNFPSEASLTEFQLETLLPLTRKHLETGRDDINLYVSLARGDLLFNSCIESSFSEQYNESTGFNTQGFYECSLMITSNFMDGYLSTTADMPIFDLGNYGSSTSIPQTFERYFEMYAQNIDSLREGFWQSTSPDDISLLEDVPLFDYRTLLQKPIFRLTENSAIIIDPMAFAQTMSIGCLFYGSSSMRTRTSAFGYAFEEYAFRFLNEIFTPSSVLNNRLHTNWEINHEEYGEAEIDACITSVDSTIIIEMKAKLLAEDDSPLYENYLPRLREKYIDSDGVSQLSKCSQILTDQTWRDEHSDYLAKDADKIYPILCVYDQLLIEGLHSKYFASEFQTQFNPERQLSNGYYMHNGFLVAPLTLLSVVDIERLGSLLQVVSLSEILHRYTIEHPTRVETFENFIIRSEYNSNFNESNLLVDSNNQLANRVRLIVTDNQ